VSALAIAVWAFASAVVAVMAADGPPPSRGSPSIEDSDAWFKAGQQLFEQLAPPEIKAQFEFPTKEQWDRFTKGLQRALEGESLPELASYADQARATTTVLRTLPGYEDLADWLEQRVDEIEGARQTLTPAPPQPPTRPNLPRPGNYQPVPHYDLWLARVRDRPVPARAAALMPALRAAFAAEGVPPEIAWLAEAESSLNPGARSPVGAKGLFQFMPETAKALGLSTFLPDERADPEKSAHAAARYLRTLHARFGNWALVFAAYNAGEGRVTRTLASHGAKSFTAIAEALPAETRMYVPKVCALITARAGVPPERIAPPRKQGMFSK